MSRDVKEVTAKLISVGRAFQVTDSAKALGQECVCPVWRNLKIRYPKSHQSLGVGGRPENPSSNHISLLTFPLSGASDRSFQ